MSTSLRLERAGGLPALSYRREGSGPAVLLVHGVGGDSSNWTAIASRLAARFEVISMDLRGHGRSDVITGPISVDDLALDAIHVLDAAGVSTCRVVGFSLGGAIAQCVALDYPERVEKLAVVGTVCGRTEEERAKVIDRIRFLEQHGTAAIADSNRQRWFTDEFQQAHPDIVAARVEQVRRTDSASYLHAFTVFCTTDFADRVGELAIPTLIVTGEHDQAATPRMARLMHERIAGSRFHILAHLRHSVLIEAPDRIASLLEGFL